MTRLSPFHLAFPVRDKEETRAFYRDALGAEVGREAETWIDFDLYGHQLSAHVRRDMAEPAARGTVDGDAVPIPHFGVVLDMADWQSLRERLEGRADVSWLLRPKLRFAGETGEQATLFILDPSGNALEFKGFQDASRIFAS